MSLDEALARVLVGRIHPAERAQDEFKSVMHSFLSKLLFLLRNDSYFGSLLNVGSQPSRLQETGSDRFEVKIVLKNLWRLVGLHLVIRLAEKGTVAIEPRRARDLESKMVLARVQHPLFEVIRPSDVIVLFAAAVSAAVPKMNFSHAAMGVPRVVMSNATVTLFVDFNGKPMRVELVPVFQFPWAFLPTELKEESHNLKVHHAKVPPGESNWSAVPQKDRNQMTWAIEFHGLENEFIQNKGAEDAMRLIQGIAGLDLPRRIVLQALLWLDEERGPSFWDSGLGNIVREVVEFLYQAFYHSKLSNFWIQGHELLGMDTQAVADQLLEVLNVLRSPGAPDFVDSLYT
ncbi:uncharacterized protein LOC117651336 isoform X2 [Thrips palmi]|uniref:Uncharacterized protein LOC117651336 isoform X2 n=1 Tax=Thrips palmi TaxID=161013 RepID=A0A6P9A0A1_THRPL|nr:uncharacterized protein LOC117651336 isoform X2 [Thrips palmi]